VANAEAGLRKLSRTSAATHRLQLGRFDGSIQEATNVSCRFVLSSAHIILISVGFLPALVQQQSNTPQWQFAGQQIEGKD
jgi:hypothetical protein